MRGLQQFTSNVQTTIYLYIWTILIGYENELLLYKNVLETRYL